MSVGANTAHWGVSAEAGLAHCGLLPHLTSDVKPVSLKTYSSTLPLPVSQFSRRKG